VTLYWMAVSHPSQVARKMLELKNIEFQTVDVLPLAQRIHLRLAGFRGGTVPALKLDGRKLQGSRKISSALEQVRPDPPMFPSDPALRERVIEAERWGEETLQPVPRRIARYAAARSHAMRRSVSADQSLPAPGLIATLSGPVARYYARSLEVDGRRGDEAGVRADLAAIPGRPAERRDAPGALECATDLRARRPTRARIRAVCESRLRAVPGLPGARSGVLSAGLAAATRLTRIRAVERSDEARLPALRASSGARSRARVEDQRADDRAGHEDVERETEARNDYECGHGAVG
jgi:hypothetical protein